MKPGFAFAALAVLVLLAGCGAGDPPAHAGGIDLSSFWSR